MQAFHRDQTGGHGYGRPRSATGTLDRQRPSPPGDAGRRSRGTEQVRQLVAGSRPSARSSASRRTSATSAPGIDRSMYSQITVRAWGPRGSRPRGRSSRCVRPHRGGSALLAIGVVDDKIEDGDRHEGIGEPVLEREVVLLRLEGDEPLHRPGALVPHGARSAARGAIRALARRRRPPPRACTASPAGSPRGRLASLQLVHGELLRPVGPGRPGEERVVRRVREQAEDLEDACLDRGRHVRIGHSRAEWPFIAGHACPSGSIGFPQN